MGISGGPPPPPPPAWESFPSPGWVVPTSTLPLAPEMLTVPTKTSLTSISYWPAWAKERSKLSARLPPSGMVA